MCTCLCRSVEQDAVEATGGWYLLHKDILPQALMRTAALACLTLAHCLAFQHMHLVQPRALILRSRLASTKDEGTVNDEGSNVNAQQSQQADCADDAQSKPLGISAGDTENSDVETHAEQAGYNVSALKMFYKAGYKSGDEDGLLQAQDDCVRAVRQLF
eukprot:14032-Heterococcus_DN1.PRE.2